MVAFGSSTTTTTINVYNLNATTGVDTWPFRPWFIEEDLGCDSDFEVSRPKVAKPSWPWEARGQPRDEFIIDWEEPRPRWREYVRRR